MRTMETLTSNPKKPTILSRTWGAPQGMIEDEKYLAQRNRLLKERAGPEERTEGSENRADR
jgi:hypothetical protein